MAEMESMQPPSAKRMRSETDEAPEKTTNDHSLCLRSTICDFDWSNCVLCNKASHKKDKRLHEITTPERLETLLSSAKCRNDSIMINRLQIDEFLKRKALYHNVCMSSYTGKRNLAANTRVQKEKTAHDLAFDKVVERVENVVLVENTAILLADLYRQFLLLLPEDSADYNPSKLQNRFQRHFGTLIIVQPQYGQGRSNIVFNSRMTIGDAMKTVMKLNEKQDRECASSEELPTGGFITSVSTDSQIHTVAKQIREEMIGFQFPEDTYPLPSQLSLSESENRIPHSLKMLILWLIDSKAHNAPNGDYTPTNSILRRCLAICEGIMFNNGHKFMPLQVGLAVQLHHDNGSRHTIDILNSLAHCIPYDELRKFMTSVAQEELVKMENGVYVPSAMENVAEGGCFIHEGNDNIDINAETIDGKNTFHSMARVIYQRQNHTMDHSAPIPEGKHKSLVISPLAESLMQCRTFQKPQHKPEPIRYKDALVKIESLKEETAYGLNARDVTWVMLRLLYQNVLPDTSDMENNMIKLFCFGLGSIVNIQYHRTISQLWHMALLSMLSLLI